MNSENTLSYKTVQTHKPVYPTVIIGLASVISSLSTAVISTAVYHKMLNSAGKQLATIISATVAICILFVLLTIATIISYIAYRHNRHQTYVQPVKSQTHQNTYLRPVL